MAKRGGATDEEITMIVESARKADPNYVPEDNTTEGSEEGTDGGDNSGNTDDSDTGDTPEGLSLASLSQEVISNEGKLTDATMQKLVDMGFAQADVEQYVTDQYQAGETIREQSLTNLYDSVGGEAKYNTMIEWAGANLSPEDITKFNTDVAASDMATVKAAMKGLSNQFTLANGRPPARRIQGGNGQTTIAVDAYRSKAQVITDMGSTQYAKDPAFREQVMQKLSRSPNIKM